MVVHVNDEGSLPFECSLGIAAIASPSYNSNTGLRGCDHATGGRKILTTVLDLNYLLIGELFGDTFFS